MYNYYHHYYHYRYCYYTRRGVTWRFSSIIYNLNCSPIKSDAETIKSYRFSRPTLFIQINCTEYEQKRTSYNVRMIEYIIDFHLTKQILFFLNIFGERK